MTTFLLCFRERIWNERDLFSSAYLRKFIRFRFINNRSDKRYDAKNALCTLISELQRSLSVSFRLGGNLRATFKTEG